MSGRNTRHVNYCPGDILETGFVLRNKATGKYIFRPDRGSAGWALWTDRRRAEAECDENEEVVAVDLTLTLVPFGDMR